MDKIIKFFTSPKFYSFIGYIILGFVIYIIIKGIINKTKTKNKKHETIKHLINGIIKYVIIIFTALVCLSVLGINVTSFLAGLGIAGVIVGLALQDIMKDALAGIFIICEGQFDVGDIIEINGFIGQVLDLSLKSTRIRNDEGKIKIISNRNITELINYSKNNTIAVVDVPILYTEDLNKVEKVLDNIANIITKNLKLVKKAEILGIDSFSPSGILYRITAEMNPGCHVESQRYMRKIIKEELDKNNIAISYSK